MQLFWRQGYEATSLQDLLRATGLSKSSLYQTFGSKHLLFERSVERYRRELVKALNLMLDKAPSGRGFIEQILRDVSTETLGEVARRGCLVMNTANEFAQRDPVIARLVERATAAFAGVFEAAVLQAQEEEDIPPDKDPKQLASYILVTMSGLKTLAKAGADAGQVEAVVEVALSALD